MILIIDNYDSFTYNLVQLVGEVWGGEIQVRRNDRVAAKGILRMRPRHIIVSPGPCTPLEAGVSNEAIRRCAGRIPILGVCLGHQCIGHVFGAEVGRARRMMHGKTSEIRHRGEGLFSGVDNPFTAARYHSLWVRRETVPEDFAVDAWADSDEVMAIRHRTMPLFGIQFHPESFLTPEGHKLLRNFLAVKAP